MSMTKLLCGLAALPLIAGVAFAETPKQFNDSKIVAKQPMQLNDRQMDKVTAGWDIWHWQVHNTATVVVRAYNGTPREGDPLAALAGPSNSILCDACYLSINNTALSVASAIHGGPIPTPAP